jgi:glycosyltransferase involved in cell wall biosynthesis
MSSSDGRVRVMRVIARLNMGGPALHVSYLTEGLDAYGYETQLVVGSVGRGEASMEHLLAGTGVEPVVVGSLQREVQPVADFLAVFRLRRLMREFRPDILHTHTAKAGAVARVAAVLAGRARPPIIVHTFHGHVLRGYFEPARTAFFRLLERTLARVSDVLIAVSPQVRDDLAALKIAPPERFTVIRLGIDLGDRLEATSEAAETRRVLGLSPERFVVGWVGRMTEIKRAVDVVEIVARLRKRGVDAVLCLVGDGPDRVAVETRAHDLGLAASSLFLGYQRDVGPYYGAFDALVLPSANEGTPVSVIESLASGTPVVAFDVGGVADVVREGVDGFLVSPGDVDAAAERLARLAEDPTLRARMGKAGAERVIDRYAVPRLVNEIDELYRTLLTRKGRPLPRS